MDLHDTGRSCLSSGFLCLEYGLQGHMGHIQHDSWYILFVHIILYPTRYLILIWEFCVYDHAIHDAEFGICFLLCMWILWVKVVSHL